MFLTSLFILSATASCLPFALFSCIICTFNKFLYWSPSVHCFSLCLSLGMTIADPLKVVGNLILSKGVGMSCSFGCLQNGFSFSGI